MRCDFHKPENDHLSDEDNRRLWESVYEVLRILPKLDIGLPDSLLEDQFVSMQKNPFEWISFHTIGMKNYNMIIMFRPTSDPMTVRLVMDPSEVSLIDVEHVEDFVRVCLVMGS